jgi:hypothetical protein
MLKLDIVHQALTGQTPCAVCLQSFALAPVMVRVHGEPLVPVCFEGYVCWAWLHRDGAAIPAALNNRAEGHRQVAAQFDRWAAEPIEMTESAKALLSGSGPPWIPATMPPKMQ